MYSKIILVVILALIYVSCGNKQNTNIHDHDHDHAHEHVQNEEEHGHEHADADEHDHEHENVDERMRANEHDEHMHADEPDDNDHSEEEHAHGEAIKLTHTVYTKNFELFAEADPYIRGQESHILAHFTHLPGFKPLEKGKVKVRLITNGNEAEQTIEHPVRPGIYSFIVEPKGTGSAELVFEIFRNNSVDTIHVHNIMVYSDEHDAIHEAEEKELEASLSSITFTKEQSWKIDFATEPVTVGPFGDVIKTSAMVESAPGDETLVSAKTNGIVRFTGNKLVEGQSIANGRQLFTISGSGLANENSEVRFAEAKNNFENAQADYKRAKTLAEDRIVSEKDLQAARNRFENTRAIYENLKENFNAAGQTVTSPMTGFVKQLFVQNGEYVTAGQPLVNISQNKNLMLHAEVQQKYLPVLGAIQSANIRNFHNNETYTLEELSGKIVSYGKTASSHNYLLPVTLQIDNKGSFIPGGFVELFLQTITNAQAVSVPNSALLEEQGNFFVMVQLTPELFEKREVKPGANNGLRTEIRSGLTGNERVVSEGAVLVKLAQSSGTLDAHSGHVH